jgi:hypothetical protein
MTARTSAGGNQGLSVGVTFGWTREGVTFGIC